MSNAARAILFFVLFVLSFWMGAYLWQKLPDGNEYWLPFLVTHIAVSLPLLILGLGHAQDAIDE